MYKSLNLLLAVFLLALASSCHNRQDTNKHVIEGHKHFIDAYNAVYDNGDINAVIEIPAGSIQKWEVDKNDGQLKWEIADGAYREIDYLGYPANYGMIPRTILPEKQGGDGDPLDVLILGPSMKRGRVVRCRVIGILYLLDRGEQDDKLIAVSPASSFSNIYSMHDLNAEYPGISEIVRTWFLNYKGAGKMSSTGYGGKEEALEILFAATKAYDAAK